MVTRRSGPELARNLWFEWGSVHTAPPPGPHVHLHRTPVRSHFLLHLLSPSFSFACRLPHTFALSFPRLAVYLAPSLAFILTHTHTNYLFQLSLSTLSLTPSLAHRSSRPLSHHPASSSSLLSSILSLSLALPLSLPPSFSSLSSLSRSLPPVLSVCHRWSTCAACTKPGASSYA